MESATGIDLDGDGTVGSSNSSKSVVAPSSRRAVLLADFAGNGAGELSLSRGDEVTLLQADEHTVQKGWVLASHKGAIGYLPETFVEEIVAPPPASPSRAAAGGTPSTPTASLSSPLLSTPMSTPLGRSVEELGLLRLHLKRGVGLKAADKSGASDPYVVCSCGKAASKKSKVLKKTLNPVWDETLTLAQQSLGDVLAAGLTLKVMNHDMLSSDNELGEVKVSLEPLRTGMTHEFAEVLLTQGKLEEADPLLVEAVAWARKTYGSGGPYNGALVELRREQGRLDEAEQELGTLVADARSGAGPQHPATLEAEAVAA